MNGFVDLKPFSKNVTCQPIILNEANNFSWIKWPTSAQTVRYLIWENWSKTMGILKTFCGDHN